MYSLEDKGLAIMRATQKDLPLVLDPYRHITAQLGLTAEQVMARVANMQQYGIIRRIGGVPNYYKLGYRFNGMTVWNIPDEIP